MSAVKLVEDKEGILLYDVKGQKDGIAVSIKVEVSADYAAQQLLGPCACYINLRGRSWVNNRWVCNLWCW